VAITEEQLRWYKERKGDGCPYCKGSRCQTGFLGENAASELFFDKQCLDCGEEWMEFIEITRIEEIPRGNQNAPQAQET
jgi:hypothetical protein